MLFGFRFKRISIRQRTSLFTTIVARRKTVSTELIFFEVTVKLLGKMPFRILQSIQNLIKKAAYFR
jgi:hypothetical protein